MRSPAFKGHSGSQCSVQCIALRKQRGGGGGPLVRFVLVPERRCEYLVHIICRYICSQGHGHMARSNKMRNPLNSVV
jgi:hypothetical protein